VSSGLRLGQNGNYGNAIIGVYNPDMRNILFGLKYPKVSRINPNFPVPAGQTFNLLNTTSQVFNNAERKRGGFFFKINAPWLRRMVLSSRTIYAASKKEFMYKNGRNGALTGYGKEVWYLEHIARPLDLARWRYKLVGGRFVFHNTASGTNYRRFTKYSDWKATTGRSWQADVRYHGGIPKDPIIPNTSNF